MFCPKCDSGKTKTISLTFPKTHECSSCGHVFIESRNAFIDE